MLPTSGGSLASCSAGQYDSYWAKLANNLAYYGLHWAYLRLGAEMDGTWFPWNAPRGSGKEASFAGCFRRIVQVMRQTQPANQWKFVLNTSQAFGGSKAYLDATWPGDAYVDVVGIDFYDQSWAANTYPYPSTCDAACRLTRQQNAWNSNAPVLYAIRDFAIAHGKKIALPEWGVGTRPDGHGGGDDPYFIQKMYDFIGDPANSVAYHGYWDYPASDFNAQLSGTTSLPQSAALFKKLFGSTPTSTNTAPTVAMTSPSAGQTVSGTVAYAASATDNAGVSRVDFVVDSTALLSDTTSPYGGSLDTTKLANGTHVLKATAYDAQGLSATSQVSINVQNATYTGTPYTGTPIALPVAFEAENFDKGGEGVAYHDLTAGNSGGQYRTSENVDIIVSADSAGGGYVVNNLQTGEWLAYTVNVPAGGNYDISVRASNHYTSQPAFHVEVDGVNVSGSINVPDTGSWNVFQWVGKTGVPLTAGKHVLKLVADAQYFNVNMLSVLASASTTPTPTMNTAPTVSVTSPSAGQTVSGTVAYAASATDNAGVSRVDFVVDSTALLSDTTSPYGGSLDTTKLANGTHVLKATAYDAQGLSATSQVSINVQNGPTGVTFTAPAANATLSGSFSDSSGCEVTGTGISRVVFFMDTTQLNTESYAPWQCKLDTRQFADGTHTLRAVAYNSAGVSTTVTRTVNVLNGPTGVTFTAPAAGATISGSFSDSSGCEVTGTGISRVVFFMDTTQLNTESYAPWQCKLDTRKFANGTHTLRGVAYNSAGASTTVTRTVNVRN